MFREIFKFLASLKLAILLLVVIILASIVGTYTETKISADVAKRYVYGNIFFDIWLTFLCINLFCVAAIRYPWKPHQTGFVITHAGIIILLIGSMIDRHWGIEGFLHMRRGMPPTDVMELREQQFVVTVDGVKDPAYTTFNVKAMDPQFTVKSPSPDVKVEVTETQGIESVKFWAPAESGPAAVHVLLRGPAMGRFDKWVSLSEKADLMMASLSFLPGLPPPLKGAPAVKPDGAAEGGPDAEQLHPRQERYYVFFKQEPAVMGKTLVGEPTGAAPKLSFDEKTKEPQLSLAMMGKVFNIPVKTNIDKDIPLEGLDGWKLVVRGYFPNFRLSGDNNQEGSINDTPENPAVKFELLGPLVKGQVQNVAAQHGAHGQENPMGIGAPNGPENGLSLYLGEDNKIRYVVKSRAANGEFGGDVVAGKYVLLKWGESGAEFTIDEFYPHAKQAEEWRPPDPDKVKSMGQEQQEMSFAPGVKVRITVGGDKKELWLGQRPLQSFSDAHTQKTVVELPREYVTVGGKRIGLSFCNQFQMMPFKVGLMKFQAPRDEGSDSTFAAFESTLSFNGHEDFIALKPDAKILQQARNPRTADVEIPEALGGGENHDLFGAITDEDATQLTMEFSNRQTMTVPKSDVKEYVHATHKIFMNYPTTFPPTWYGPWLGTTYKFSQADHRPDDPDYSGVQVLRDPGWMPKWVGCLMICFGIFTMFYLKPYFNRRPATSAAKTDGKTAVSQDGKSADKEKKKGKVAETRPA